jgi:endothelin-converting enzyme
VKALAPTNYTADTMLLPFPEFLGNVSQILSETPKSTIQSFLIWNLIVSYSSYVEAPDVEPISRFNKILSGQVRLLSR